MHLRPCREDHLCGMEAGRPKGGRWVEKSLGTHWNCAKNRARALGLGGPHPLPGGIHYHGAMRAPILAELGGGLTELTQRVCSRAPGRVGVPREELTARPAALSRQVGLWKSQAGAQEAARGEPEAAARELRQARGALAAAEADAGRLRRGQAEVRRRAEKAREAVLRSLGRVRELEALARQVPGLQRGLQRLEGELRRYR